MEQERQKRPEPQPTASPVSTGAEERVGLTARGLSRRDFLRLTGVGLTAAGLGGLGLLGGCSYLTGGSQTTVPPTVTTSTAPISTTVTTAPVTTEHTSEAPVRGGSLQVGSIGDCPYLIEPNAVSTGMTSDILLYALFDTLVRPKPGVGTFAWEMALADSVTMESPNIWTIRLREGATWSDGTPITASDLAFSFRRALRRDAFASPLLTAVDRDGIEGLPATEGRDGGGIRLTLKSPDSMLIDSLWRIFIVPKGYDPAQPLGSGPYRLINLTAGEAILMRNWNYWGSPPYVDRVVVRAFPDEDSRVSALLGGSVDAATMVDVTQADKLEAADSLRVLSYNSPMTYSLDMNVGTDPFSEVAFRQACRYAANRTELVTKVFAGRGQAANDLMCPADPNYAADLALTQYDPERAKALLTQSGWSPTSTVISAAPLAPGLGGLAAAYAEQASAVGISMTAENISSADYYGSNYAQRPVSASFWLPQPLSVQVALTRLPQARYNPSRFDDDMYASLFAEARAEKDAAKRRELFAEMQLIEHERGASIIPVTPNQIDAYSKRVGGVEPVPLACYPEISSLWLRG